jgi:hypothetical protein
VLGTYTGLHTVGWAGGAFLGPALVGGMVDLTGWPFLMAHIAVVAAVAALTLAPAVRGGSRQDTGGGDVTSSGHAAADL